MDPLVLLALAGVGLVAGFVDAVAGGGGLIGIPALLSFGFPPIAALATNKFQGAVGTLVAAWTYWRRGLVQLRPLLPATLLALAGSALGAATVRAIDTSFLGLAVPVALIGIAGYFLLAPSLSDADRVPRLPFWWGAPVLGFSVGYYDGIFGPGTGSFFTMGFVLLLGFGLLRAAAHTKVLNEASNLAALAVFVAGGDVVWPAAIAMALGQVVGGRLGALSGIRWGARIIRPLVVVVSIVLAVRLLVWPQ